MYSLERMYDHPAEIYKRMITSTAFI